MVFLEKTVHCWFSKTQMKYLRESLNLIFPIIFSLFIMAITYAQFYCLSCAADGLHHARA